MMVVTNDCGDEEDDGGGGGDDVLTEMQVAIIAGKSSSIGFPGVFQS